MPYARKVKLKEFTLISFLIKNEICKKKRKFSSIARFISGSPNPAAIAVQSCTMKEYVGYKTCLENLSLCYQLY